MTKTLKLKDGTFMEARDLRRVVVIGAIEHYDFYVQKLKDSGYIIDAELSYIGASKEQFRVVGEKEL